MTSLAGSTILTEETYRLWGIGSSGIIVTTVNPDKAERTCQPALMDGDMEVRVMPVQVSCNDLGIKGCSFAAVGETPGDVIRAVVEHVRAEHNIEMPEADTILEGRMREDPLVTPEEGATLIVRRLAEKLDTLPPHDPDAPGPDTRLPPLGRTPIQ